MSDTNNQKQPTRLSNRIELLDVCRGFAIFGIFVVNLLFMNCAFPFRTEYEEAWNSGLNSIVLRLFEIFFYSKFFTIFSFLFGMGITLQFLKRKQQTTALAGFYIRRFGLLFLIGAAHLIFIWSGDILHLYAILGFAVILLINLPNPLILVATVVIMFFPFYTEIFDFFFEKINLNLAPALEGYTKDELIAIYREGSYMDILSVRIGEYTYFSGMVFGVIGPTALSMMLLGGYVVKKGHLSNLQPFLKKIKYPVLISGLVAFAYHAFILYYMIPTYGASIDPFVGYVLTILYFMSEMTVAIFYLFLIAVLFQRTFWNKLLRPLRYVGRMALSNYLLQSVAGFFLMTSFGFGLYLKLSPAEIAVITTGVFILQIPLSKWWLSRYKFGPMEWLWRCGSYRQWISNKK